MLPQVQTFRPSSAVRRSTGFGSDWNRLFDEAFGLFGNGLTWTAWTPAADLYETPDEFVLEMGLPGFDHDNIELTVERGILTVSGQRPRKEEDENLTYHVREHTYDRFTRSFALPASVNADDVKAEFDNGMLIVRLPKLAEARPRRIQIAAKK